MATPGAGAEPLAIQQPEYDERVRRVRQALAERGLDALVLFHPIRMAYVAGFFHLQTERPIALVVPVDGDLGVLVPHLERLQGSALAGVGHVKTYPEYPTGGTKHPMEHLRDLLSEMGLAGKRLGYDHDGHHDVNSYDGPPLSEVFEGHTERARDIVDTLRLVKSENELRLIRESARWGDLAHRTMHERVTLGCSPLAVSIAASADASLAMIAALGPGYRPRTIGNGTPALVRFKAGANTLVQHGAIAGHGVRRGDVLVTYAIADVGGYHSELERTMIVGEPNDDFVKYFELMVRLQQVAFGALKPGRPLAEAEAEVCRAYEDLGAARFQQHHSGHGLGLEGHEAPFIDKGDERLIQENMVVSVEPGLYVPGLAGFRHSDTAVVKAGGAEPITTYPRDLTSLTVRV
jgi:Xaa-Pro aminopeptidase